MSSVLGRVNAALTCSDIPQATLYIPSKERSAISELYFFATDTDREEMEAALTIQKEGERSDVSHSIWEFYVICCSSPVGFVFDLILVH